MLALRALWHTNRKRTSLRHPPTQRDDTDAERTSMAVAGSAKSLGGMPPGADCRRHRRLPGGRIAGFPARVNGGRRGGSVVGGADGGVGVGDRPRPAA